MPFEFRQRNQPVSNLPRGGARSGRGRGSGWPSASNLRSAGNRNQPAAAAAANNNNGGQQSRHAHQADKDEHMDLFWQEIEKVIVEGKALSVCLLVC